MVMKLEMVQNSRLSKEIKGWPKNAEEKTLSEISSQGWSLLNGDLPLPVATLKQSVIEDNSNWMRLFTEKYGARISPHGKTTMAPQLFQRQLEDGAWAITVATVHQLRLCRHWGIRRVLMANQVAGKQNMKELCLELAEDPEFDFYLLADSTENVDQLAEAARKHLLKKPIQILVELGFPGGRTGCRNMELALEVARRVQSNEPNLALRGVEGYEALLRAQPEPEKSIRDFLEDLSLLAQRCAEEGLFGEGAVILSAGGSDFFDLVLDQLEAPSGKQEVIRVIRSGCYLTHDSLNYKRIFEKIRKRCPEADQLPPGLMPALQVWGAVQSLPEPGLAIVNVGKRDISYDAELPIPEMFFRPEKDPRPQKTPEGCRVNDLNDQHANIELPEDPGLRIGDLVGFGISHPCTTFDKWRLMYLLDDDYRVTGGIRIYMS